uniref:Uncharacterized protein n=1 Tax=Arundo donax TaxID=35708 RepID=A0A0A9D0S7_ARUDO
MFASKDSSANRVSATWRYNSTFLALTRSSSAIQSTRFGRSSSFHSSMGGTGSPFLGLTDSSLSSAFFAFPSTALASAGTKCASASAVRSATSAHIGSDMSSPYIWYLTSPFLRGNEVTLGGGRAGTGLAAASAWARMSSRPR